MPHLQAAEVKYCFRLYLPWAPSEYFHSLLSCTARNYVGLEHREIAVSKNIRFSPTTACVITL